MEGIIEALKQFALAFRHNAFYRSLAYGILFSIIMTLIIGAIVGVFSPVNGFPYIQVRAQEYWVGIVFVSFSFLFAFFGYVSDLRSREDILTPLRKKLVGHWEVRLQTWKIEHGEISLGRAISFCTIGIEDIGRKLVMHFEIRDSDILKDQKIDITAITLGHRGEPRQLVYFYDTELALRNPIGTGTEQISKLEFPFLGVLNIRTDSEAVNSMDGRWYDVENSLYNLARRLPSLKGMQELATAVQNGGVTFKGSLEFNRLPTIPGGA